MIEGKGRFPRIIHKKGDEPYRRSRGKRYQESGYLVGGWRSRVDFVVQEILRRHIKSMVASGDFRSKMGKTKRKYRKQR